MRHDSGSEGRKPEQFEAEVTETGKEVVEEGDEQRSADGQTGAPATPPLKDFVAKKRGRPKKSGAAPTSSTKRGGSALSTRPRRKDIKSDGFRLVGIYNFPATKVEWVWHGYIPLGTLTLVSGDPGVSKSLLVTDIAAIVSRGGVFPDGSTARRGNVAILNNEDDPGRVIMPRLKAAGADPAHVFLPSTDCIDLGTQLDILERELSERKYELLIVDPLTSHLRANSNLDTDVRHKMAGITDLAKSLDIAVIGVRHNRKSGGRAIHRGHGTVAFSAAARTEYTVAEHPTIPGIRVLACTKNNYAELPPSLAFTVEQNGDGNAYIRWQGLVDISADELCSTAKKDPPRMTEAINFLRSQLKDGPCPTAEVEARAMERGISPATLRRARRDLGVLSKKKTGKDNHYILLLPDSSECVDDPGEKKRAETSHRVPPGSHVAQST
jgi:putative DNA primase/helicase